MKTVAQVLATKVQGETFTISAEDSVLEAIRLMADKNIGALPVLAADGALVGIVSERDYARKMVLQGRSSIGTPVSEIMTSSVVTVDLRQNVRDCMELMTNHHLRHLPIIEEGRLVGLLSIGDLVKETISEQQELIQQLEQYIRGE